VKVDGKSYRTIWLGADGTTVQAIDQTLLPHQFVIRDFHTVEDAEKAIRTMIVRGAPLIGAAAAYGMALAMANDPSDANLERAYPDKTPEEREQIALRMWGNLGRVMVETMNIDRILREPDRLHVTNGHVIGRYKEKMGPVLIVTMHMGNWELGMWPIMLAGVKPAGVYRLVKNPYVDRYLRAQRKDLYPGGLFGSRRAAGQDEGQKTARLIMDYVRQGGRLGFISDLYDAQGVEVPFFGYPAKSMPIAAMIARRVGARIWIGRCIRIGDRACFDINVNELRVPRTNNQAEDIRNITAAIQRQFEGWIRENPDQFMWSNRRWS